MAFKGYSAEALRFLRDLAKNNERAWFYSRKPIFERELLEPWRAMVADLSAAMRKAKIPLGSDTKGRTFRIYRDIRFSADKSPYKTNLGAFLAHGDDDTPGGLYIHIQPKESFFAAGFYQLDMPLLQRWREAMAAKPAQFQRVLEALKRNGARVRTATESDTALKRMPKGFEAYAKSPIADYFRLKSFMASEQLTDRDVSSPRLINRAVVFAKKVRPLLEYGWSLTR
jgi:uncharacterized protein (TIGR02453 family)